MIFRRVGRRERQRTAESGKLPAGEEKEALQAMLAHAWEVTRWHNARADARDRLSAQIVTFAGVLLALMPQLRRPLETVALDCERQFLTQAIIVAAACFISAVLICLVAIARPVRRRRDRPSWPQEEWKRYRDRGMDVVEILERQMDAIVGELEDSPPYIEIAASADRRERLTRAAITALAIGVVFTGYVLVGVLAGAILPPGVCP